MKVLKTKLQRIQIQPGKRILVLSDIHGHLTYLQKALKQVNFSENDILVIVGDLVEKGTDNLGVLRYVKELCEQENVVALIGNVDAWRVKVIDELNRETAEEMYQYIMSQRKWHGTSFYDELAMDCGYKIESSQDVLLAKGPILDKFQKELDFLAELPTIVETQNFIFVHGGLVNRKPEDNLEKDIFELTKYDCFMTSTEHIFDKYLVVGHWPVSLYRKNRQDCNPIIDEKKRIISIDGGCGTKAEGQLNVLIIPDIDCDSKDISYIGVDGLPCIRALDSQEERVGTVEINWMNRHIQLLERGEEFSYVEHKQSGRKLCLPNSRMYNENECRDYTDYQLAIEQGNVLKMVTKTSQGCIVKKDGIVGWYYGRYEVVDVE